LAFKSGASSVTQHLAGCRVNLSKLLVIILTLWPLSGQKALAILCCVVSLLFHDTVSTTKSVSLYDPRMVDFISPSAMGLAGCNGISTEQMHHWTKERESRRRLVKST
jgi:hypothetical protein